MKPIFVLNGPNLNRLGMREPEIYGKTTLAEIEAMCRQAAGSRPVRFHQSNIEGEIVNWIHEAIDTGAGILINPAGLSFSSIPVLDALKMFPGPDRRVAHLEHPPSRGNLPSLAGVEGGDRRDRRPRRQGLSAGDRLAAGPDRRLADGTA